MMENITGLLTTGILTVGIGLLTVQGFRLEAANIKNGSCCGSGGCGSSSCCGGGGKCSGKCSLNENQQQNTEENKNA